MTSVGETLRRERLRRNLELDQISRELRISTKFLEAIEEERFELLPGPVFAKSFVRQYAQMLGLNDQDLATEVGRLNDQTPALQSSQEGTKPVLEGIHVPRMDEWSAVGEHKFRWSSSLSSLAGVVVVMLVCSAVYTWWQRPKATITVQPVQTEQAAPAQTPPADSTPAAPPAVAEATPPAATDPAQQAPPQPEAAKPAAPVATDGTPKPTATPGAPAAVRVELLTEEPVWVLARADGQYLFSGTLEANQTRVVEAATSLIVRFGNAGGVNVTLNGKNLGALGPKGQVRTIQFTSGGFQIVPAPKPSAPVEDR